MIPVDPRPRPIPRRQRTTPDEDSGPPSPFGPYRAARNLETILGEVGDDRLRRAVVRHHSEFIFGLNQLEHLPSVRLRKWFIERFAAWYRQHLLDGPAQKAVGQARDAWTHLVCVVVAHARDRVREINAELHDAFLEATRERRAAAAARDRARSRARSTK